MPRICSMLPPAAYKVSQVAGAGVGLVASRDLVQGELILTLTLILVLILVQGELILSDSPTILAPPTRCRPQCLQCSRTLTNLSFVCKRCGFPLCGPGCQEGGLHRSDAYNPSVEAKDFHILSGLSVKYLKEQTLKQRLRISMWRMITMQRFYL